MSFLVHYPSRGRPELFRRTLDLYLRDPIAQVLVTLDHDDPSMNNPEMLAFLDAQDRVSYRIGECKSKVEACNDGLQTAEFRICMIGCDDMLPQYENYAQRIVDLFDQFFPDGDGVLHLDDGRVGQVLNTLPIFGRKYFDRFGYCYHPSYVSVWCDNEWQQVSERLGRAIYVPEVIVRHCWIGESHSQDPLHLHNEGFHSRDAQTFKQRQAAGFPA